MTGDQNRRARDRGGPKLIVRLLLALLAAAAVSMITAPAQADDGDAINDLAIEYTVRPSGVLHVKETFEWDFPCCNDAHGIQRELITREPDGDHPDQDIVYKINNLTASSPDGVSTMITEKQIGRDSDRNRRTRYRIGDPTRQIYTDPATYVIEYDVVGAMRHFDDHDELYWDATGSENPPISRLSIRVDVPGGAQQVRCFTGPIGSTATCDGARVAKGQGRFSQQHLAAHDNVSIGIWIKSGLVTDNKPHLVPKASIIGPRSIGAALLAVLLTIGTPIVGLRLTKRWMTDDRYLDLPPGTVPAGGESGRIGPDSGVQIPVAFTPPDIPVAEAVQLLEHKTDERITAATIVELAAAGVLTVEHSPRGAETEEGTDADESGAADAADALTGPEATEVQTGLTYKLNLVGADGTVGRELTATQSKFCKDVFGDESRTELLPGKLEDAHFRLKGAVRSAVDGRGWFAPRRTAPGTIVFILLVVWLAALIGACWLGGVVGGGAAVAMIVIITAVSLLLTVGIAVPKVKQGKRTADGRAVLDLVEGFREYLSTAEAEQLKFEEGQDIFSRYLPWAIIFGMATRWQQLCQQLVELGRLPDQTPAWYASPGDTAFAQFHSMTLTSMINSSLNPPPPAATDSGWSGGSGYSGGGFGSSGSSFSGGGFSGGGGGGGGSSSW